MSETRPARRIPSLKELCEAYGSACVKCGNRWFLERAHVIDRANGGLDLLCNLRPLCAFCHHAQPRFRPGEEEEALAWFYDPETAYWANGDDSPAAWNDYLATYGREAGRAMVSEEVPLGRPRGRRYNGVQVQVFLEAPIKEALIEMATASGTTATRLVMELLEQKVQQYRRRKPSPTSQRGGGHKAIAS